MKERKPIHSKSLDVSRIPVKPVSRVPVSKSERKIKRSGSNQVLVVVEPKKKAKKLIVKVRPGLDLSLKELSEHVSEAALLDKREPREESKSAKPVSKNSYEPSAVAFRPSKKRVMKSNLTDKLEFTQYSSDRQSLLIKCVAEDKAMKCEDPVLLSVYNKGIFNEDNDTDDSAKKKGVDRGFKVLKNGLRGLRSEKRKPGLGLRSRLKFAEKVLDDAEMVKESPKLLHTTANKKKSSDEMDIDFQKSSPIEGSDRDGLGKPQPQSVLKESTLEQLLEMANTPRLDSNHQSKKSSSCGMEEEVKSNRSGQDENMDEEERPSTSAKGQETKGSEIRGRSSSNKKKVKRD